jgi:TPR repeat protein
LTLVDEYYRRTADTSLVDAELVLAELLLDCFKRNKDAFSYLKRAAEKEQPFAQYRSGKLYGLGHGCEQNSNEVYR